MPLRQKTHQVSPFSIDSASPTEALVPLSIENQSPSSGNENLPLPNYNFAITIVKKDGFVADDVIVALFQKVSGIGVSRETDSYSEGGHNEHTWEFPGQISYGHLNLEAGLTSSRFFYNWMMTGQYKGYGQALNFILTQRRPNLNYVPSNAPPTDPPTPPDPDIFEEVKKWQFHDAFPVKWKISDLSMGNSKSIVIESLELSFNYIELTT